MNSPHTKKPGPSGISFGKFHRIETPSLPNSTVADDIVVLEVPVRRLNLYADFLVSYVPLNAGDLSHKSRIRRILVPQGSVVPAQVCGEVHWLPPLREQSPVAKNTYTEQTEMTIWHYLALGLFPSYLFSNFMEQACKATEDELSRDLWEYTGHKPDLSWFGEEDDEQQDGFGACLNRLPTIDQERILRYRSPLELCTMARRSLFAGYEINRPLGSLPFPIQEIARWSESLTKSRCLSGRNGLG